MARHKGRGEPSPVRRLKRVDNAYSEAITAANLRLEAEIERAIGLQLFNADTLHLAMARQAIISQAYAAWERQSRGALQGWVTAYQRARLPVPPLPHKRQQ